MSLQFDAQELIIIKKPVEPGFTPFQNELIKNKKLSWKATGLLMYLLSLPKTNWKISIKHLCNAKTDGEASVCSAKKMLEELGFLKVIKVRDGAGRYKKTVWIVRDEPSSEWNLPELENPVLDNSAMDFPEQEKHGHINTDVVKINLKTITTTTSDVAIADFGEDERPFSWLSSRLGFDKSEIRKLFIGLSSSVTVDILAELYSCKKQGGIKKTEMQFLKSLIKAAHSGGFNLSAGYSLREKLAAQFEKQDAIETTHSNEVAVRNANNPYYQDAKNQLNKTLGTR